jgi:2-methylisocitrate lyase-like PEP mutase family enzyme
MSESEREGPRDAGPGAALRQVLETTDTIVVPGTGNALFGRMAQEAGFRAVFASGSAMAMTAWAIPDLGLMSFTEVVNEITKITSAITIPVVADADTGFGEPMIVFRSIQQFVRAGVAAIELEDQATKEKSGYMDGKSILSIPAMLERMAAAKEAIGDSGTLLIARVEALADEGLTAAIDRALAYDAAGADVSFISSPKTTDQLKQISREVTASWTMATVFEGSRGPQLPLSAYRDLGFNMVGYPSTSLRMAMAGVRKAFEELASVGDTSAIADEMYEISERNEVAGLSNWLARAEKFAVNNTSRSVPG